MSREELIAVQLGFAYIEGALTTAAYVGMLMELADAARNAEITVRVRVADDGTVTLVEPDVDDRPPAPNHDDAVIDGREE